MKERLIKNSLLYIVTLKQRLHRASLCWVLILPYQTLFILLVSIQSVLTNSSGNEVAPIFTNVWKKLNDVAVGHFFLAFQAIACVLLAISFLIFICLKKKLGELDERSITLNKIVTISAALVILMEIFLFNTASFLLRIITNYIVSQNPQRSYQNFLYILPFCCIAIIVVGLINYRIRIMGSFFIGYLLLDQLNTNLSFIHCAVGIAINLYLIRNDEDHKFLLFKDRNLRKILHLLIISFFIWKFINLIQISQNQSHQGYLTYIYLLVYMFLSIVIGIVKFVCKINRRLPPVIQLCQCLQVLTKDPQDIQSKLVALEIEHQYIQGLDNGFQSQESSKNSINNWNSDQWYNLVHEMIKKQYEKYSSLESGIDMIKCRLMIKDKQIFDIIQFLKDLIQKNKHQSLTVMYEVLKVSLKIQEVYFKKHQTSEYPIIQILREVDRLNEIFYKDADKQMKRMHSFWETVISKKIKADSENGQKQHVGYATEIRKLTVQIYRGIGYLEETAKKIELLSLAERQKKVLKSIKQICFQLSHHKEQNTHESQFHKNNQQSLSNINTQNDFLEFIEVVNEKVTNISLKLLSDLRYQKRQVLGQSLNLLIPSVYVQSIQQTLKNHYQPIYKFPYLIPVKCADHSVVLKRLRTYLEIDSDSGYKVLFHFERTYAKKDPFIIYNTASNIIESYNRAFLDVYKLDSQKINAKIANNYLNPDQIFVDLDLHDKNIQTKLSENGFETEYNCRLQTAKISKKTNNMQSVRISLIQKEKGFMILKIMKGHRMKSIGNQNSNSILSRSHVSSNIDIFENPTTQQQTGQFTKMKSPDENQIFCKIQNPYETKIGNKKLQISKPKKISLQFYAIAFICAGLVLFLVQGIVFICISYQIQDLIKSYNQNIINEYNQYTVLMVAYEQYFQQALIKIEKDRLTSLGMNYDQELNDRHKSIEEQIDIFQREYLANILNTNQHVLDYPIKFKYFQIVTDTSKTNLFDFSQNLLQYNSDESLEFLRNNYPTFSDLILRVNDQANGIGDDITFFTTIYYIVSGVIFAIILACLIGSTLIRLKVCWICADVEYIFKLVNFANLKQLFHDLEEVSKKLMENGQEDKQKYIRSQKVFQSSMLIQHQKATKLTKVTESRIQLNQHYDETESINKEQNLQKEQAKATQKQDQSKKAKIKKIAKSFGIVEYFCFAITIVIATSIQIDYFSTKISNDYSVINYNIENRKIIQNTVHQILEVTYYFLNKNISNGSHPLNTDPFINKLTINDKFLPSDYFGQYSQYIFDKDLGDLCEVLKNKKSVSFDENTCKKVGGGIFKFGLTKTIEYLNQILYYSIKNQYWYSSSQFSNLSQVEQIEYIQEMITAINNENEVQFNAFYDRFNIKMEQRSIGILLFQFALALLLLLAIIKAKKFIYETSEVARGYFLLLPQKVLIQNKILDHIRKQDLLNRITKI